MIAKPDLIAAARFPARYICEGKTGPVLFETDAGVFRELIRIRIESLQEPPNFLADLQVDGSPIPFPFLCSPLFRHHSGTPRT
jgi:hypothetical protein